MRARTHILSGIAIAATVYGFSNPAPLIDLHHIDRIQIMTLVTIGAAAAGAITPDLDIPESSASSKIAPVNQRHAEMLINIVMAVVIVLVMIYSKYTAAIYLGAVILALISINSSKIISKLVHYLRLAMQYALAVLLAYLYIRSNQTPYLLASITLFLYVISKHRGISHTPALNIWTACVIFFSLCYYGHSTYALPVAGYFLLGTFVHIYANDLLTDRGVPNPLYPLTIPLKLIALGVQNGGLSIEVLHKSLKPGLIRLPFGFQTDGPIEDIVSGIMIVIIILCIKYL